jgi:hypothetical protein
MEERKHTPGPWRWHAEDGPQWFLGPGVLIVEDGMTDGTPGGDSIDRANAHLIAAAPELLEALKRCQNFIANTEREMGETLECGETARAAIAKARGEA